MTHNRQRIVAIVQARMGSERLPGKVLAQVGGSSLLSILIHRLKQSCCLDEIVVATTTKKNDDAIVELAKQEGVRSYRGSEQNVLGRYCEAAKRFDADVIVRVTADNPLTDPELMDRLISAHLKHKAHYTYCPDAPLGTGVEIVDSNVLDAVNRAALTRSEREHVTLYIQRHPDSFSVKTIACQTGRSSIRLTVDTIADLALMNALDEALGPLQNVRVQSVLELFENNPELFDINAHVAQRDINDRRR